MPSVAVSTALLVVTEYHVPAKCNQLRYTMYMTNQQNQTGTIPAIDSSSPELPASRKIPPLFFVLIVVALSFLFFTLYVLMRKPSELLPPPDAAPVSAVHDQFEVRKFASAESFQRYFEESQSTTILNLGLQPLMRTMAAPALIGGAVPVFDTALGEASTTSLPALEYPAADRVSETNVQVRGIDEPDILKTNGKQIFLSKEGWYRSWPQPRQIPVLDNQAIREIAPAPPLEEYSQPKTEILTAFPPAQLAELAEIDLTGQLLLDGNTLVVIGSQHGQASVTGFDVSQPAQPVKIWKVSFDDNSQLVTARLKDGQMYFVTQSYNVQGCPVTPLYKTDGERMTIPCTEIYYPTQPVTDANSIFTAVLLDPQTGEVKQSSSIVGSSGSSAVYMSADSLYIAYRGQADMVKFMYGFLSSDGEGIFPADTVVRLEKLQAYDIGNQAKMVELQAIIEGYMRTLSNDERLKLENELQNRIQSYLEKHARQLEETLIVKFDADSLAAEATGQVPGYLLNQFSLDEYKGNLRVATTFGQAWTQFGRPESASDVYVLDSALRQKGAVLDLGKTERIYSVRFLNDRGYVVTFRQVDPFYILDLSDSSNPQMTGELKIPGYSSYLHPIGKERVLGVGMEDGKVKVSLFDVSNARDPRELAKYMLDEYSSELLNNHRAFLIDEKYRVFFMPGMKGGYIFSYADDQLSLVKAVSRSQVRRAIFMNDYLYVLGEQGITVLDEKDWEVVKELAL